MIQLLNLVVHHLSQKNKRKSPKNIEKSKEMKQYILKNNYLSNYFA